MYEHKTTGFGKKLRTVKLREQREVVVVSCRRHLNFREENEVRFSAGVVVFHKSDDAEITSV